MKSKARIYKSPGIIWTSLVFLFLITAFSSSAIASKDVEIIDVEQIGVISVDSTASISVTIKNTGGIPFNSEDDLQVKLYINSGLEHCVNVPVLGVDSLKTVTVEYTPKSEGTYTYKIKVKDSPTHEGDPTHVLDVSGNYDLKVQGSENCYTQHFDSCYGACMDECIRDTVWTWDINTESDATIFDYANLNSKGNGEFEPEAIHPIILENGELDLLHMKKNFMISYYIEIRYVDYEDTGPDPSGSYNYKESDFKRLEYLPPIKLEYK